MAIGPQVEIFLFQSCFLLIGAFSGICNLFEGKNGILYTWKTVWAIFVTWILIIWLAWGIDVLKNWLYKLFKTSPANKIRYNMLIGSGACLFFGLAPRIFVFFVLDQPSAIYYSGFVCLFAIIIFHGYLVVSPFLEVKITVRKDEKHTICIILIHFLSAIMVFVHTVTSFGGRHKEDIATCQFLFCWICCMSNLLIWDIGRGNLVVHVDSDGNCLPPFFGVSPMVSRTGSPTVPRREYGCGQRLPYMESDPYPGSSGEFHTEPRFDSRYQESLDPEAVSIFENPQNLDPRLECKICLRPYNEFRRTPRLLKECGHTVCEACVDHLLKKGPNLHCPFCQRITVVNGPARMLPKNYTMLDMIDERKMGNVEVI